jgi:hypothetical protein
VFDVLVLFLNYVFLIYISIMVSKLMRTKESFPRKKLRKKTKRKSNSRRGSAGSSRRAMFTHRAADGQSGAIHETGEEAPAFLVRSETSDDDLLSPKGLSCKPSRFRKTRNLIAFAIIVVLGQVIIAVSLKRLGWIEKDINEMISEKLMPQIQQLEQSFAWSQFNDSLYWLRYNQSMSMGYTTQELARPGYQLAEKGARVNYPIVMIPGFVTSGLEVWRGKECAKKFFRQRMVSKQRSRGTLRLWSVPSLFFSLASVGWSWQRPTLVDGTSLRHGTPCARPADRKRP